MSITKLDILRQTCKHLAIRSSFLTKSTFLCIAVVYATAELKFVGYSTACADSDAVAIMNSINTRINYFECMEELLENLTGKRPTPAEAFEARVKLLNELIAEEENKNE